MSTIVYQGLPSFLDTQLNESRTLRLKLASPRSHLPHSLEMAICTVLDSESKILFRESGEIIKQKFSITSTEPSSKTARDGLSFLQGISNVAHTPNEWQSAYVHPLVKRASSVLSDKSLELCTENLGSETGTDVIEEENIIFSEDISSRKIHSRRTHVSRSRRMSPKKTFPPPLSTMMGSETVQVRPIRENGRLILKAVKVQPKASYFQADRSNGRLRLRFVVGNSSSSNVSTIGQENTDSTPYCSDQHFKNSSDRKLESVIQDEYNNNYMVGNWKDSCKEGESGNGNGLLRDESESIRMAS